MEGKEWATAPQSDGFHIGEAESGKPSWRARTAVYGVHQPSASILQEASQKSQTHLSVILYFQKLLQAAVNFEYFSQG